MSESLSAPTPEPTSAPTPAVTPVAAGAEAPVSAATAPSLPAATAETAHTPPPAETSLLGDALKPVEPAPTAPEPPKVEAQSDEPAPPPTFEPFNVPDGVTLDADRISDFTGLLAELHGETKAETAALQKFGQKAVDMFVAETQRAQAEWVTGLNKQWTDTKKSWADAVKADPEIGGNRFDTSLGEARQFIRTHLGSEEDQARFLKMLDETGVGNHPELIRALSRAQRNMTEPRQLRATTPAPDVSLSKLQTLYGNRAA